MNLQEIITSLRLNGQAHIADVLEKNAIQARLVSNRSGKVDQMYGDIITEYLGTLSDEPLTAEDVILSPEFAMLRSVATIMASYMPMVEIEIEVDRF